MDESLDLFNPFEEHSILNKDDSLDNNNIKNNSNLKDNQKYNNTTNETTNIIISNNTQREVQESPSDINPQKKSEILNRKIKNPNSFGEKHSKYATDNLIRKIKHIILDSALKFINEKIKEKYHNNIGFGISRKKLLIINQGQIVDSSIDFNKKFMDKKIGEIFSDTISTKYTSYHKDFNKDLINNLMAEKDLEKRVYFQKLFSLTFSDCLSHFRGSKKIKELEGLKLFSEYVKEKGIDKDYDYNETLNYYISEFEENLNKRRERNPRKRNKNKYY